MNDTKINEAIALHVGWERKVNGTWVKDGHYYDTHAPDYCNDLNLMHGVEHGLVAMYWDRYAQWLRDLTRSNRRFLIAHATARQRAEAFLRTVGKWRGE